MLEQIDHWISGLSKFELGLLIYFYILFLIWIWVSDHKAGDKKISSLFRRRPVYQMAVDKKRFVREVVKWGLTNMPYEGIQKIQNRTVNLEISYYKHKKHYGVYCSFNKKIKVYVNTHSDINEMIDSSLHELCHHFQYCADPKKFQTRYRQMLEKYSYDQHPMEIEARKMAGQYIKPCFEYLIEKNYLKIVG